MSAYTAEDVQRVTSILRRSHLTNYSAAGADLLARRVMAVLAPAILARAHERLRDMAFKWDAEADANADTHPKEARAVASCARELLDALDAS